MSEYCRDDFGLVEQADDDFKMWQGLVGPHYTPSVSEDGTLSWSNNGQLPNPEDVSIKGPPGEPGPPGAPGPGVPAGGTTGQLLAKTSDEDYDTEWIDPPEMDAGHVSYDSTEAYSDGTVGKELGTINSALTSLASVTEIIDTASGAIASFPDGSGLPMRSLVAEINPVQDLHGYDAPWAGGAGANKLRTPYTDGASKTGSNVTYTVNSAGQITIACSASASGTFDYYLFGGAGSTYESTGLESGTYTFAVFVPSATTGLQMFAFDEDGTSLCGKNVGSGASQTFSIDGTKKYRMFLRVQSGNTVNTVASPTIVSGSTAPTAWTPYANICPISGWTGLSGAVTGFNVWDEEWEVGGYADASGMPWNTSDRIRSKVDDYIPALPSTDYFIKCPAPMDLYFYDADKQYVSHLSKGSNTGFTTPTDCYYIRFATYVSYGTTYNHDISINYPSTDTSYHAYTGEAISVSFPTTVYGGTVDVVTGVLTVDRVIQSSGFTRGTIDSSGKLYPIGTLSNAKTTTTGSDIPDGVICNYGEVTTLQQARNLSPEKVFAYYGTSAVSIFAGGYVGSESELDAILPSLQFVYPLAQPQTYQLTPQQIETLLGNNTVFVDTGSVSVTYQASIKGYIDKVLGS